MMFKSYLRVALRNLAKHKGYTFINLTGLAVGLACCLLILLYVRDELSYDRFNEHADRVYRANVSFRPGDLMSVTPSVVAPAFRRAFPEVESAVRIYPVTRFGPVVVQSDDAIFQEEGFLYADSTLFDVFTFPFVDGDPRTALVRPNTIVLTRSTARKYFGDDNPIGKTLTVDNARTFEVTGVLEEVPSNAHFTFDFVASLNTLSSWSQLSDDAIQAANFVTYFLLRDGQSADALEAKIPAFIRQMIGEENPENQTEVHLQPLTAIHLHSADVDGEMSPQGDIAYVYAFSALALLILLVACINYMNLATARSARRAKEVGMRKALGAYRANLSGQFFIESFLMTLLALGLSLALAALCMPAFNSLTAKALDLSLFANARAVLLLLGAGLLVSLIAGSYPALYLSSFRPTVVLKGTFKAQGPGSFIRKGLVVFQFAVSAFLIVGTLVIYRQLGFIQDRKLGFDKEHVVVLNVGDRALRQTYQTVKSELTRHPNVLSAAVASDIPGYVKGGYMASAEGMPEGERYSVVGLAVDEDIVETLGLTLKQGRGFTERTDPNQEVYRFLLNETAVRRMGLDEATVVGKQFNLHGRAGEVVGVVEDFNFFSLRDAIEPLVMFTSPSDFEYMMVKIAPADVPGTLAFLEEQWKALAPHRPFEYTFLDAELDALYRAEMRVGRVFTGFSVLAILIACLGLFGLAAFTAEQRTKEIGVRKVLGASEGIIVYLLSKDFIKLVLIAFVVGMPAAYFAMERWLQNFVYRIDLGVGIFVTAGLLALAVAALTVSYQAVRTALLNPVDTLRYE